jgi:hypothetical protein
MTTALLTYTTSGDTTEQRATLLQAQSNLEGNVPQRVVDAQGNVADLSGPPPDVAATAYNHPTDVQRNAMDALPPPPVNWSMGHPSNEGLTGPQYAPSDATYGSASSGSGAGSFSAPNETTWEMMSDPVAAPGRFTNAPSLPSDHFVPFFVNSSRAQSVSTGGDQSQPMPGPQVGDVPTATGTPLGAIYGAASGTPTPTSSAALGYADDASGGLGYGSPVMDNYRGAPASGVNQPGYGDPQLQQGNVYALGRASAAPLSPFESAMAGVRSSVIPKYIAVTHHVPNPDYVAQFGPIEPPMPDFMGMLAKRFGASPVGRFGDYLLNQSPPPLPLAPPLPIIQDPDAIRALLVPALQALQNQRALAAMQAGRPGYGADNGGLVPTTTMDGQGRSSLWDDANRVGGSLASLG